MSKKEFIEIVRNFSTNFLNGGYSIEVNSRNGYYAIDLNKDGKMYTNMFCGTLKECTCFFKGIQQTKYLSL